MTSAVDRVSAIVDAKISGDDIKDISPIESETVSSYRVNLPNKFYRAVPPTWIFIIALDDSTNSPESTIEDINRSITIFLEKKEDVRHPILVASFSKDILLINNFRFHRRNVFLLDSHEINARSKGRNEKRYSPLTLGTKRSLSQTASSNELLLPYSPNIVAKGWKFFGRESELKLLTETNQNYFVCGARKIGKTSLLRAAERTIKEMGSDAYFVSLENCQSMKEMADEILGAISARSRYHAATRNNVFDESFLESTLKSFRFSGKGTATLILDEFGNVVNRNRKEDWQVVGLLRKFAQAGRFRIIMSGFQEFAVKQFQDFNGPYVNFATTMTLGGFSNREIREFIVDPLRFWGARVNQSEDAVRTIVEFVGRHPFILQHMGSKLFENEFSGNSRDLIESIRQYGSGSKIGELDNPMKNLIDSTRSVATRYIFVCACQHAEVTQTPIYKYIISDDWLENLLESAGYESTFDGRRLLLESLEMHGFTRPSKEGLTSQMIGAPIIYRWLQHREPNLERLLEAWEKDMARDPDQFVDVKTAF